IEEWKPKIEPPMQVGRARFYRDLSQEGHTFGPAFQGVDSIWYAEGCSLGKVVLPASIIDADRYVLHPAQLDACLQVIRGFRGFGASARADAVIAIPLGLARLRLFRRASPTVFARAKVIEENSTEIVAEISIIDDTGRLVAILDGFRCLRVARAEQKKHELSSGFYRERWGRLPAGNSEKSDDWAGSGWLILADRGGVGEALSRLIQERHGQATLVFKAARERQIAENSYETTASSASFGRIIAAMDGPPGNIVYLWPLEERRSGATAAAMRRACRIGVESILALLRALADHLVKPRLWVVTAGAADQKGQAGCT